MVPLGKFEKFGDSIISRNGSVYGNMLSHWIATIIHEIYGNLENQRLRYEKRESRSLSPSLLPKAQNGMRFVLKFKNNIYYLFIFHSIENKKGELPAGLRRRTARVHAGLVSSQFYMIC